MDPATLTNEGSFGNANATSFNLAEIWKFPINGGGASVAESGGGLGLRMPQFAHNIAQFGDVSDTNGEASANGPIRLDRRGSHGDGAGGNGGARKRRDAEDESSKCFPSSSGNGVIDCDGKRLKNSGCKDETRESQMEAESCSGKPVQQINESTDPPKQDFIHVRARRGQATDSHSLAERARRERISERMKTLQDLVPSCNKVIGKALVLDEIINYIQSLQRQVEFLSMKLETVNSRMNPAIGIFPSEDINEASQFGQQTTSSIAFPSQLTREFSRGSSPEWLHMQVGGDFERTT